jgi:hypothetical protein
MININEYPLTYFSRISGKEFKGKTLIQGELIAVVDLETGIVEKLSLYKLKKRYRSDSSNKKRGQRSRNARAKFYYGPEYEEYLESEIKYDDKTLNFKIS